MDTWPASGGGRDALASAAHVLDAEIASAEVDEQFALVLRACAHGGQRALTELCDRIADPGREIGDAPALALLASVSDDAAAAERAVRAAVWTMVAQRVAETWPLEWFDVLGVARAALPMTDGELDRMRNLVWLTRTAVATEDAADREGLRFQFHRESLEDVIGAATGRAPARRDMLMVISHWSACFAGGIRACDARLRELAVGPSPPAAPLSAGARPGPS